MPGTAPGHGTDVATLAAAMHPLNSDTSSTQALCVLNQTWLGCCHLCDTMRHAADTENDVNPQNNLETRTSPAVFNIPVKHFYDFLWVPGHSSVRYLVSS